MRERIIHIFAIFGMMDLIFLSLPFSRSKQSSLEKLILLIVIYHLNAFMKPLMNELLLLIKIIMKKVIKE